MIRSLMITGLAVLVMGCTGPRPARLGVVNGMFMSCPDTPNCICSQSTDKRHAIDPILYKGTPEEVRSRILSIIRDIRRARIVTEQDHYLHVEFTSVFFRFIDDAEFYFDDEGRIIHIRSAARVGYWDLGVNRKRMEMIRRLFNQGGS